MLNFEVQLTIAITINRQTVKRDGLDLLKYFLTSHFKLSTVVCSAYGANKPTVHNREILDFFALKFGFFILGFASLITRFDNNGIKDETFLRPIFLNKMN